MTVRDKVWVLNTLKVCMGCGVQFNFKDTIYIEDTDLFAVHGTCMTRCQPNQLNKVFSFVPLSMAIDEPDFMERLKAKHAK